MLGWKRVVLAVATSLAGACAPAPADLHSATDAKLDVACRANDGVACHELADRLARAAHGDGALIAHSLQYDAWSCRVGYAEACVEVGSVYEHGDVVTKDLAKALMFFRAACDLREADGCALLGITYAWDDESVRDDAEAERALETACSLRAEDCGALGAFYWRAPGVTHDAAKAFELEARACAKSGKLGCVSLADMYYEGEGVPRDVAKAHEILRSACKHELGPACIHEGLVGILERSGSVGEAHDGLRQRCRGGDDGACLSLAALRMMEAMTRAEARAAKDSFEALCSKGVGSACHALGLIWGWGYDEPRNPRLASTYFKRGCDAGDAASCALAK